MALEQPLRVPRKFENLDALVHVGLVGFLVAVDPALTTVLLGAPLVRHFVEERDVHAAVELVHVHRIHAALEAVVLGSQPHGRFLLLPALIGMAGVQRVAHPFQHLVVELQPPEQFGELHFQRLLAYIFAAARSRVALALIGVAGAMVVDVTLLLDLADHRTAAFRAGNQAREREVVRHSAVLLGEASIQHALHPLPQLGRDQRLVPALHQLAVPLELASVEPVAQDRMDRAHWNLGAALAVDEARVPRLTRHLSQRALAGRVPLEQLRDDRGDIWVGDDDPFTVRAGDIAITERRHGRPNSLLSLLQHPLAGLFRQVVDVVLCHQHFDAVHELFRRARLPRQHHTFLGEMDFHVQLVQRHPVLEVAVEPISLLDQQHAAPRIRL